MLRTCAFLGQVRLAKCSDWLFGSFEGRLVLGGISPSSRFMGVPGFTLHSYPANSVILLCGFYSVQLSS